MGARKVLHKPVWLVAVAVAALAAVAAACGDGEEGPAATPAAATPTPAGPTPVTGAIDVDMGDNFFVFQDARKPDILVAVGQEVTVNLVNDGQTIHNMHIAGVDNKYDVDLCTLAGEEPCSDPEIFRAGDTGILTFQFDQPGTFDFRCDFHPDEMVGTITVQ
ncbi:MAG: cupredoxin domain-containing protein [Dehalococcoidia bacterium]